jgi:hypothetical protein
MSAGTDSLDPIVFSPNLRAGDAVANYWLRQVTLRLRREVGWLWHERGAGLPHRSAELPPATDRASDSLDLSRHWAEKQDFFATDDVAVFLTEQLSAPPPVADTAARGSFGWVMGELSLDNVSAFALALGLASSLDASVGAVIAACLNDPARVHPTLMLMQRLWHHPEDVLSLADPMHPLFAFGLLRALPVPQKVTFWEQPLMTPPLVARALVVAGDTTPAGVHRVDAGAAATELTDGARLIAYRLQAEVPARVRLIPLLGARRAAHRQTAIGIARIANLQLWEYRGDPALLAHNDYFAALMTVSWLSGHALLIKEELFDGAGERHERNASIPLVSVPVTIFVATSDRRDVAHIDPDLLLPFVDLAPLSYEGRLQAWREGFGAAAAAHDAVLREMARRFRYERDTILGICRALSALPQPLRADDFVAACRAELSADIGELATYVAPRFGDERLILPNKQTLQFEEQITAMQALTAVHYEWGTAGVWNEGGITILFAGPPGTGKTMAAEIMARRLTLPMYRIDLSQVVNKYIGETEKNLKRVFDAAEMSDMVLFFDEADSLFGKRIEANDARDRYANLEVSYLLERMERFKGLAILATNRKTDFDHAFLRRIRHVIDFPVPDEPQRAAMWRQSIPKAVAEQSRIDIAFLARQFPLSGGHIRSIVFNACLQSAHREPARKELFMKDVIVALKREYDKMNRALSLDQLGPYAADVAGLD